MHEDDLFDSEPLEVLGKLPKKIDERGVPLGREGGGMGGETST